MSCTRRQLAGGGGPPADAASRRAGAPAVPLPPIVEERLLDTTENSAKVGVVDDAATDSTDCCRCCCLRRDLEAPPAWRDLDIHGVRSMLPSRRRRTGSVSVVVRRYVLVPIFVNNKLSRLICIACCNAFGVLEEIEKCLVLFFRSTRYSFQCRCHRFLSPLVFIL